MKLLPFFVLRYFSTGVSVSFIGITFKNNHFSFFMPGSIEGNVEVYVLVFISNLFRYRFNSVQLYLNDWGLECVLFRLDFIFCVGFEYYNVLGKFRLEFSVSSRKGSFDVKVNINIIESILPIDTPTFPTNV